jgi:hypothetical protein
MLGHWGIGAWKLVLQSHQLLKVVLDRSGVGVSVGKKLNEPTMNHRNE